MRFIDRIPRGRIAASITAIIAAVTVSAVTAVIVAGLIETIDHAARALVDGPRWLRLSALPVGLVLSNVCLRVLGAGATPSAGDAFIASAQTGTTDLVAGRGRLAALVATLASGLPLGTEGPAVFVGSLVAGAFRQLWFQVDRRVLIAAAAAGGAGFVIGSWVTGALFVVEAPWRRGVDRRRLPAAVIGGFVGWRTAVWFDRPPLLALERLNRAAFVSGIDELSFGRALVAGVVVGVAASLATRVWVQAFRLAKREMHRPLAIRIGLGVVGIIGATVLAEHVASNDVVLLGTGERSAIWASGEQGAVWAIVLVLGLRIAASSLAQFAGGVGGVFVPSMVPGMLAAAALHHAAPGWFPVGVVALGGVAALGAGYGVPLTAFGWLATAGPNGGEFVVGVIALAAAWWPNRNLPVTAVKVALGGQTARHE